LLWAVELGLNFKQGNLVDANRPATQAQILLSLTALFAWDISEFTATRNGFEIRIAIDGTFEDGRDRACVRHSGGGHTLCAEGEDLEAASARLWGMLGNRRR